MATRAQKIQVSVFLATMALLLVGAVVLLSGSQFWTARHAYTIRFAESVSGLEVGAAVKYRGVRVGSVTGLGIERGRADDVLVHIEVEPEAPITTQTEAQMVTQGITGLKFVELLATSPNAPPLLPGREIPSRPSILEKLTGRATDISLKAEILLNNLIAITDTPNQERIEAILVDTQGAAANLQKLSQELAQTSALMREVVQENRQNLGASLAHAERAGQELPGLLSQASRTLSGIDQAVQQANLPALGAELRQTNALARTRLEELDVGQAIARVSQALATMQAVLETLGRTMNQNQDQLRATLHNLRQTSESLRTFGRTIEEQPSRLLFDEKPPARREP